MLGIFSSPARSAALAPKKTTHTRVEDMVHGDMMFDSNLTIAESGSVHGTVRARTIVIFGSIHGDVFADSVQIRFEGEVHGNISCKEFLAAGGILNGSVAMGEDQGFAAAPLMTPDVDYDVTALPPDPTPENFETLAQEMGMEIIHYPGDLAPLDNPAPPQAA